MTVEDQGPCACQLRMTKQLVNFAGHPDGVLFSLYDRTLGFESAAWV